MVRTCAAGAASIELLSFAARPELVRSERLRSTGQAGPDVEGGVGGYARPAPPSIFLVSAGRLPQPYVVARDTQVGQGFSSLAWRFPVPPNGGYEVGGLLSHGVGPG